MSPQINFEKAKQFFSELSLREKWFFVALYLANFNDRKEVTTTIFRLLNADNFRKNIFFMLVQQFEANGQEARDFVLDFCRRNRKAKPEGTGMVRVMLHNGRILCNFINQFEWDGVWYWEWYDHDLSN